MTGDRIMTLEQAIAHIQIRRKNLDHIYEPVTPQQHREIGIREDEIDRILEVLRAIVPDISNPPKQPWGKQSREDWPISTFGGV